MKFMGNWLPRKYRGFLLGLWNCHALIGNIIGNSVAGALVDEQWSYCFYALAGFIWATAAASFLLLVINPEDVNCSPPEQHDEAEEKHKEMIKQGEMEEHPQEKPEPI